MELAHGISESFREIVMELLILGATKHLYLSDKKYKYTEIT